MLILGFVTLYKLIKYLICILEQFASIVILRSISTVLKKAVENLFVYFLNFALI